MLPAFMRVPPPLFSLKKADESLRFLLSVISGTGSEGQKQTAAAMLKFHRQSPFDFGVTLGDNFYSVEWRVPRIPDGRLNGKRCTIRIGIRIYATLGNHDWGSGG
jgi:hypothetical protein